MIRHIGDFASKAALVGIAVLTVASCSPPPATGGSNTPAHDLKTLMQIIVQPQADVFWRSTGTISDENGVRDLTPTTDAGWLATRSSAATLAEMGAILKNPIFADGKGEDWLEYADALTKISMRAQKAAEDRDSLAVMDVGSEIYNVCSACHQTYQPPVEPEKIPGSADFDRSRRQ